MKTVRVKNTTFKCYTIAEFAAMCGKSTGALRKMEQRGVLPLAPLKLPIENKWGSTMRLYPEEVVTKSVPIISSFKRLVKIDHKQVEELVNIFENFKERIKNA